MPNWCENDLTVAGKTERLKEFRDFMHAPGYHGEMKWLSEEKLIPYPMKFQELDKIAAAWDAEAEKRRLAGEKVSYLERSKDGFNSGGYEWCIENWGTKWGFCHEQEPELEEFGDGEGELTYRFDTAWSPPLPLIRRMGELFKDLTFALRYFECGAGFNGTLRIENGEETDDRCGAYFGDRGG